MWASQSKVLLLGKLVSRNVPPILYFIPLVARRSPWHCNQKLEAYECQHSSQLPLMYCKCIKHLLQHLVTYVCSAQVPMNGYDFSLIVVIPHLKVDGGGDSVHGFYRWSPQYAIVNGFAQDYQEQGFNTTFIVTLTKRELKFEIPIRTGYSFVEALGDSVVVRRQVLWHQTLFH